MLMEFRSSCQAAQGRSSPCTGWQSITKHINTQSYTAGNLEIPINLTACLWTAAGSHNT